MQIFTTTTSPLQLQHSRIFNEGSMSYAFRFLFCFFLFNTGFNATTQAQCPYDISLVSKTYNPTANRTTFVWKVVNPHPGNGNNGTVQDLSHWGFTINPCTNPANALHQNDIVSAGTGTSSNPANHTPLNVEIHVDPSQNCTANIPVLKFDVGTNGSTPRYYSLVLSGNWGTADLHAYYKSGVRTGCGLCTIAGAGVGCRITCPTITVAIITDLSQFPVNRTISLSANVTGGATPYTYLWSSTAGVTFNSTTSSNPVATILAGISSVTFNVTVTDANGCHGTATTTLSLCNITITTPILSTNPICPGTSTGTITVTNPQSGVTYSLLGNGVPIGISITYVSGPLSFTGLATGNYVVRASVGGCPTAMTSAILELTSIDLPTPTFNTIGTLCPGATALLSAAFPAGTTVTNIVWSGTGVNGNTFTAPATPGDYTISFNATVNGCTLTATRTITVANPPAPVFGAIGTLCPGATATLTATFPAGTTVSNIVWSGTGVSGTTFTAPATAGTYTVNFNATVNGCTVTASLNIVVAAAPSPTFGTIGTLCPGASATLTATFPSNTTVTNIVWSGTGVSGNTFTAPATGGNYTIVFSATVNGCVVNGSFVITVATVPAPTFNTIGTLCPGATATLSATFPPGTTVTNVVWSGTGVSGTTFTAPNAAGNYTITFTATVNGCTLTATRTIAVANAPAPVFGAIGALCPGATALLSATFPAGTTVTNIVWSGTGVNGNTFTAPATAGVYTVNFSATVNGCTVTGTLTITVVAAPAGNFTLQVTSGGLCAGGGGSFVLSLSGSQAGVNYQLIRDGVNVGGPVAGTGSAISFPAQTVAGSYSVLAIATSISQNTCVACTVTIGPITVSQSTIPTPTFGTIGTLCPGATATLSATFPAGTTVTNISWSGTGVSGTTFTAPAAGGNYVVTFSATVNGCPFTTTLTITVANVPAPTFGSIGTLCPGATATLTATFPAGTTVANIVWSGTGVSGTTFTAPAAGGNYTVNFSATVNGCPVTASMTITVATVPTPTFGAIGTLCPGSTATLTATFPAGTTVTNVVWSGTGVSGNIFTAPSTVGTYTVNFSATVNGCLVTGSMTITVAAAPAPIFTAVGPLCSGTAAALIATFPAGTSVTNVVWSGTGVSGTTFTAPSVTTQTNYTVNFSATVNNCTVTGFIIIVVRPVPIPLNLVAYDYCPGGIGAIGVLNIEAGVSYQVRIVGGVLVGTAQTGAAGTNLLFPNIPAGYYQIVATYLNTGCVNAFGGVTITQNAVPPCTITGPTSVCMGTTNTYTVQTGAGATNIQWSVQGGNCIIVGSSTTTTASIKAVGPGTFIVRATVSYGSCTTTCELTVTSTPLAVSAGNFIACPNSIITLTGSPAGGVWASTNAQVQAGINNTNSTFNSTGVPVGNYPVTYTVTQANGCTGTALGSITVFGAGIIGRLTGIPIAALNGRMVVTMNDSRQGITYQLMRDGVNEGSPVQGNGGKISFGTHDASGMYSVVARSEDGGCIITGGAGRITLAGLFANSNRPEVVAYPNPFSDQIRFSITSSQSGRGTLQLFDLKGAKLKTIDVGKINAGQTITIDYAVPGPHRVSMIYKLNVGGQETTGKLVNFK